MSRPLVTIVIATYRSRHDHLSAAILSALGQTWGEIEIIVTDDSPDDELRAFVETFGDARLRYRRNVPALGVARNHWVAFGEAKGDYIALLNHDDWIAPTFIEKLVGVLHWRPEVVLAFCDHWVIDVRGRRLLYESARNSAAWGRKQLAPGMHRPFSRLVSAQTIPMAMGALFRRSALPGQLPADAGPAYDLWLAYLLCSSGGGAWYVNERLSAWRAHSGNLSSEGGLGWLHGSATCWQAMADDTGFAAVRRTVRRKAALDYYGCALRSRGDGRRIESLRYAARSLRSALTLRGIAAMFLPLLPQGAARKYLSLRRVA